MRLRPALFAILTPCSLLAASAPAAQKPGTVLVQVSAGAHDRRDTVVFLDVPAALAGSKSFTATTSAGKAAGPVQLEPGPPARLVWILRDALEAGQTRTYRISGSSAPAQSGLAAVEDDGRDLAVRIGKRTVLKYHHKPDPASAPKEAVNFSGYLHPVFDPDGRMVTAEFYSDHMHQHGIMFTWADATVDSQPVDVWNGKTGWIEHAKFDGTGAGPACAWFRPVIRHVAASLPGGERTIMTDNWTVRVYTFEDYFLFDLESVQSVAGSSPYQIKGQLYGGLTLRGALAWREGNTWEADAHNNLLTSDGKDKMNASNSHPKWVDMHGVTGGKVSGIAVMDHPGNFRFPQPIRLRPEKPYFCFGTMLAGPFTIEPGKPLVSRYRYYVHNGAPDSAVLDRLWNDYAEPPVVRVVSSR